jgi:hypothetical protein
VSRRAAVSLAAMQRMRRAIEREGLAFRGYRQYPDGSVEALVGEPLTEPAEPAPPSDPLDAELAEWDAAHGHG